jgi:parallel beta-helix repeat protein
MKSTVMSFFTILCLLLAVFLVGLVSNVQLAEASGTIYLRADGSVDPPTAPISTIDGATYTLTGDIEDSIVVEKDNIILDGAGHTVQGTDTFPDGILLEGRNNVTIKDMTIKGFYYGIRLWGYNEYNVILGNNITANGCGILIWDWSNNNRVSGNNITANYREGIQLGQSHNNIISGNSVTTNYMEGILLRDSSYNSISENNITNNSNGIEAWYSSNNIISENNITYNLPGIGLGTNSSSNSIRGNNIAYNWNGIVIDIQASNKFYHNNFIGNIPQQVTTVAAPTDGYFSNVWDDGYPSGGNYWSDYNGTDADHDGIGDTHYLIDVNNTDNYPLMGMFSSFKTAYRYMVDFVSNSYISNVSFDLSYAETYPEQAMLVFNVSGKIDTKGFLRVCIPKVLINGSYVIEFDGEIITNDTSPQVRELPCSNGTYEYLYINYTHSEHRIIVTGTTIIPEFPSFLVLQIFFIATLTAVIIYKRKQRMVR